MDAPPLIDVPDAVPIASLADDVIFVIKSGGLSINAINEATSILKEANANILGAVLNQVKMSKEYYYKY